MARRQNFGFEKRQRELRKKKKKEEKAERKRLAKEIAAGLESGELVLDAAGNPVLAEEPSEEIEEAEEEELEAG